MMNRFSVRLFISMFLFIVSLPATIAQSNITGRVLDEESRSGLEFAQLALMMRSDSTLITGTTTDVDGAFNLQTNALGPHLLRVSFIGYEIRWLLVDLQTGSNELGNIPLRTAITQLGEVGVSAAAALFRSEADRRIFNVENMTIAEGGTAIQLLEALPSVQLDEEGNISMRGSGNILIYINGRPSNLSSDENESILEQYPAHAIKDIELITNPSARFDAEGVGGIINLILKEDKMHGFNAQLNLSAGTGNKYSGGTNLNFRRNRWNSFVSYSYQYRELWERNESIRENFYTGSIGMIDQDFDTENFNQSHLLRLGTGYAVSDKGTLRVHSSINARSRDRERYYYIRNMSGPALLDSMYMRELLEDQSRHNIETGASFSWDDNHGRQFNSSISAAWDQQDRIEYFNQQFFDHNMSEVEAKFQYQFYERPLSARLIVMDIDYQQALGPQLLLETGLKSTLQHDDLGQNFRQRNNQTLEYEEVLINGMPISNRFIIDQNIHAAYLIIRNTNSRLAYLAGLRAEMTTTDNWQDAGLHDGFLDDAFVPVMDTTSTSHYFNLFPSLFLNYEISGNQDIQFSYSRRIRRPGVSEMMPFINAQDFYNLRLGNPYLEPAFTNNAELNYLRAWTNNMITAGVFHRYTRNDITRLFVPYAKGALVTWTNAGSSYDSGLELIHYFSLNNNIDATLTGNFFHSRIKGKLQNRTYDNESYSWTLSLLSNMNIPGWVAIQASANYWGPRVIPQGHIKPVFSMNLGLRRSVMSGQGTLSLNVTDMFNTRRFTLETTSQDFYQLRDFSRESRILTLTFTWRFRDYRERNGQQRRDSIEGEIEGLY
jgi:iron complex outermembrane recepter protein